MHFSATFVLITLKQRLVCFLDHFAVVQSCHILRLVCTKKDVTSTVSITSTVVLKCRKSLLKLLEHGLVDTIVKLG